jgi:preprotein translocase subunit SecD
MKSSDARFNIIFDRLLLLLMATALASGCKSTSQNRHHQISTLELHLEVAKEPSDLVEQVGIFRSNPVHINVERHPFLFEKNIKDAKLIENEGGFSIKIQFDRQGTWLLEQYSGSNRGRRFAVFCEWVMPPEVKKNDGRWVAAPKITQRITDGVFTFSPDATREEVEQIVFGLNNVAERNKKADEW